MTDKSLVKQKLENLVLPNAKRSITELNLVREISIDDAGVNVTLASTTMLPKLQDWLKKKVTETIKEINGVKEVNIKYCDCKTGELNNIKQTLAVMSGKGGVGKSLVTGLVAVALKKQGYQVGILDADITGPSIPKMFGVNSPPSGSDTGILPVVSETGIPLMSINLILPDEGEAVIWRGPMIANAIKQFHDDVLWGNLDYLVVDLPPGTADAPLTVMQSFPISGVIIVFTPQDLVDMIVKKALNMARKMDKKVLGVVENMSYLYVPELDKNIEIFGESRGETMSEAAKAPLLGQIPIDPELAKLCDAGSIEEYDGEVVRNLSEKLKQELSVQ